MILLLFMRFSSEIILKSLVNQMSLIFYIHTALEFVGFNGFYTFYGKIILNL